MEDVAVSGIDACVNGRFKVLIVMKQIKRNWDELATTWDDVSTIFPCPFIQMHIAK
jgi:hypothetical protein